MRSRLLVLSALLPASLLACEEAPRPKPAPATSSSAAAPAEVCGGLSPKLSSDGYLELATLGKDGETLMVCLSVGGAPGEPRPATAATECVTIDQRTHGMLKATTPAFFQPAPRLEAEETAGSGKHTIKILPDNVTICANTTSEDCRVMRSGATDPATPATWGHLWQHPPADVSVDGTLLLARKGALETYAITSAHRTASWPLPPPGGFVGRVAWMGKRALVSSCDNAKKTCVPYLVDGDTGKSTRLDVNGKPLELWGIRDAVLHPSHDAWLVADATGNVIARVPEKGGAPDVFATVGDGHPRPPAYVAKRPNGEILVVQAAPLHVTVLDPAGKPKEQFGCDGK